MVSIYFQNSPVYNYVSLFLQFQNCSTLMLSIANLRANFEIQYSTQIVDAVEGVPRLSKSCKIVCALDAHLPAAHHVLIGIMHMQPS